MSSRRAIEAGKAFVEFYLEDGRLIRGLRTNERRMRQWSKRVGNISKQALKIATAGLAAFAFPARTFGQFDDRMRQVKALTKATTEEFRKLTEQAKELGRTTSFTASDVGGAQIEQSRAGFKTADILKSTKDILNLARANDTELPRATEIAAGTLRGFGLDVGEMGRVVNVATATVNNSAQTLEDYAEAMKVAAPIARQYGMSLEETSKMVGLLADFQIKGSAAGTAIRKSLLQVADPRVRRRIQQFTPVIDKTTGKLKTLDQIARDLGSASAGESAEARLKRLALFSEIFGQKAVTAAAVLSGPMKDAFDEAFGDKNFAADIAEEMDAGIGGAIRRLQSAFEGFRIAVGESVSKMGSDAFDTLSRLLGTMTRIVEKNPQLVRGILTVLASIAAMATAGLAASVMLKGMSFALGIVRVGLVAMGKASLFAMKALFSGLASLFTPLGIVTALVAGLAAWFIYTSGAIQKVSAFLSSEFGDTWKMIVSLIGSGDLEAAGELALALLRTAWTIGVAKLDQKWSEWTGGLAMLLLEGVAGAELIWNDFTTALINAFDKAIAAIRSAWQSTTNWLADKIAIVIAKTTGQDVEDVRETLREDQARVKRDFSGEAQRRANQRNRENEAKRDEIGQRLLDEQQALKDQTAAKIAAAEREALAARKAFDDAQAKAAEKIAANEGKKEGEEEAQSIQTDVAKEIASASEVSAQMEAKNSAVLLKSTAGQEALASAIGINLNQDPVKSAVEAMQEAVVEEQEKTNKALAEAPVLKGTS